MTKKLISSFLPLFFFGVFCFQGCSCLPPTGNAETRGMFVFGSSLVDNGNNNIMNTTSRADYLPYGLDFPEGPSGRFSNGKNVIDALGCLLKLPHRIPAFTHPMTNGRNIVNGVNYASGGSGILDETGSISGRVINLNQQIRNFEEVTLPDLSTQLRCNNRELISSALPEYLFVVGTGGNDYLLNYFLLNNINKPSLQVFTSNLTDTLSAKIKRLYSSGARKFVLLSVYPLGCIPMVKAAFHVPQGCLESLNQVALLFNSQLRSLVDVLKPQMPGSNLVYVNSYQTMVDIITDPTSKGFSDTSNTCCEVSSMGEGGNGILCKRRGLACEDRNVHVFFDGLHPTEAVNVLIASKGYSSNLSTETYPFNVRQLAML